MEEKINIAEILKDKPKGIRLYSPIFGECAFCYVREDTNDICVKKRNGVIEYFNSEGLYCALGEVMLFPSKSMRDWETFAWKRGDVLVNSRGLKILFDRWANDNYTSFYAKTINLVEDGFLDTNLHTLASEKEAKSFIKCIEEKLGGKLNRETLEVEKAQPEFKDGDMVSLEIRYIDSEDVIVETYIVHGDYNYGEELNFHAWCNNLGMIKHNSCVKPTNTSVRNVFVRYATDSEKQQLFSALAKENKAWDSEKKEVVNLKPKVELKPFDKVLVRDSKSENWRANLFGYIGKDGYYRCVYANWVYCIPYIGNEHLLGTTKDVEG